MGFLDEGGLSHLWDKIKEKFLGRDETVPVIPLTKNEYDNLSNEDKKKDVIYTITDEPIPASDPFKPDGGKVPVGTIISFMGTTAPEGYLACDGATYPIASYPKLASFIKEQFGSFDHFGSNGAGTFGVPDMRNLFLRGFHGDAEEKLSGDIGVKQEATKHTNVAGATNDYIIMQKSKGASIRAMDYDSVENPADGYVYASTHFSYEPDMYNHITSRPVNTAVLYCIKAYEPNNRGDEYSTEEQRIGTWIDGKPLYRRTIAHKTPAALRRWDVLITDLDNWDVFMVPKYYAEPDESGVSKIVPMSLFQYRLNSDGTAISMYITEAYTSKNLVSVFEYTKTTD